MPKLVLCLFSLGILTGCNDRAENAAKSPPTPASAEASTQAPSAGPRHEVAVSEAAAPTQANSTSLPAKASWSDLLESLPAADREHLKAINARYFGALAFQDATERKRLLELGFPSAEDILAASKLTDGELKTRADGGDELAQMLLVDRLLAQAEQARASGDQSSFKAIAARAMFEASMLIPRTQSPFGAYLDGRANWQLVPGRPPEVMAASLMVAADLGDWRAKTWLKQFERENPGLDAAATLTAYNVLRRTWRVPQEAGAAKQ